MLQRLSDPARRALRTAVQAFLAVFGLALLGWLQAVVEWTSTRGEFPDLSVVGLAAVAGAASAAISLVTWGMNVLEDRGAVKDRR